MSPLITIGAGGQNIPPGAYKVQLNGIDGPRTIVPKSGPNAGEEVDIFSWSFVIEEGDLEGTEIEATTSTRSGPRSKLYAYLVALFGGAAPPAGTGIDPEHIIGRSAIATIEMDDSGWPRITALSAIPMSMRAAPAPVAAAAPVAAPAAAPAAPAPAAARPRGGIRNQVAPPADPTAVGSSNLPF